MMIIVNVSWSLAKVAFPFKRTSKNISLALEECLLENLILFRPLLIFVVDTRRV